MKRALRAVALLGAILLCIGFGLAACSNVTGYSLSGSVASPSQGPTVPDGTYVYLKLVASGGAATYPALYWTRAAFAGGSAIYSITGIAAGSYTGWAFIDIDGQALDGPSAMPDASDYSTASGQSITIPATQTQNLGAGGWIPG